MTSPSPTGADLRRGPLRAGDRVQLTDPKGRYKTIELRPGEVFHTYRGTFRHDDLIGRPDATVITTTGGVDYLVMRPLLTDWVLSMPRGAAVVYPKDAAQIVAFGDIFPGARVIEAGAGSGGLTMSLLRAVGDHGSVLSAERRPEFAEIARANVEAFFGGPHPAWRLKVGDVAEVIAREMDDAHPGSPGAGVAADARSPAAPGSDRDPRPIADRIVLDMVAPWENLAVVAAALEPGGVLVAYVATVTQLSRLTEAVRDDGRFTEPIATESMIRGWHLAGLAVRPDHRMVAHTGFLLVTRRMAPGYAPPARRRRPAPGAYSAEPWAPEDLGERPPSERKLRRLRAGIARETVEGGQPPAGEGR